MPEIYIRIIEISMTRKPTLCAYLQHPVVFCTFLYKGVGLAAVEQHDTPEMSIRMIEISMTRKPPQTQLPTNTGDAPFNASGMSSTTETQIMIPAVIASITPLAKRCTFLTPKVANSSQ